MRLFGGTEKLVPSEENRYFRSNAPALDPDELDYEWWIQNYREHSGYERQWPGACPLIRVLWRMQTF